MPYIWKMGAVLVLFGVLGLACSLTAQYFAAKAAVGFGTELRHDLFAHINSLSYAEIDQAGSATLVTRMTSDINQVQSGVNLVLRLFLRSPFIVVGAMIMAFTISVKAALIFVVAVPLLAIVIYGIMMITIPLYKKGAARAGWNTFIYAREPFRDTCCKGVLYTETGNRNICRGKQQFARCSDAGRKTFGTFKSGDLHYCKCGNNCNCLVWWKAGVCWKYFTGRSDCACQLYVSDSSSAYCIG